MNHQVAAFLMVVCTIGIPVAPALVAIVAYKFAKTKSSNDRGAVYLIAVVLCISAILLLLMGARGFSSYVVG